MAKSRDRKEKEVKQFVDFAQKAKTLIFVRYKGVSVKAEHELRRKLRDSQSKYVAVKRTLLRKAFEEMKVPFDELKKETGSMAAAFGLEDEISVARTLHQFSKENEGLQLVGGIFEGSYIGKEDVVRLANLPSKQELMAKLVYLVNSPLRGLVTVLSGPSRGLVQVLHQLQQKKS